MVLCKYWAKGNCRNGASCRFEHPPSLGINAQNTQRGPFGGARRSEKWSINVDDVKTDLTSTKPNWILTAYGPGKDTPATLFTENEYSPEEVRFRFYQQQNAGNAQQADQEAINLWNKASKDMQNAADKAGDVVHFMEEHEQKRPNRYDFCKMDGKKTRDEVATAAEAEGKQAPAIGGFGSGGGSSSGNTNPFSRPAFGQTGFGQPSKPGFGQPAFGGSNSSPSPFSRPAFGAPASTQTGFGQTAPSFGQSSGLGQNNASNPFSKPAATGFGQQAQKFGQPAATSGFGQQQPNLTTPPNASPFSSRPAFGSSGFGSQNNSNTAFGKPAFGSSPFAQQTGPSNNASGGGFGVGGGFGQTAFGSNAESKGFSTAGFGSNAFGSAGAGAGVGGGFLNTAPPPSASQAPETDMSADPSSPTRGFGLNSTGAFGGTNQAGFGASANITPAPAFGAGATSLNSAFGKSLQQEPQANSQGSLPGAQPTQTTREEVNPLTGQPAKCLHYTETLGPLRVTQGPNGSVTSYRNRRVELLDKTTPTVEGHLVVTERFPVYDRPDGKGQERIWFPNGPAEPTVQSLANPQHLNDLQDSAAEYTDTVKKQYTDLFEKGLFEDGKIPLCPPMREWILYDI